ncbi:opioid-binding protein/cell adhesion molecule-like isoform X2 [Acropora muricata]|uniref:opioid-binding protein/cell adhesion molecule-like isoform X2 n=1 Tax=Acropora muricata TaxID=159855 RepID=UPI0034E4526C
MSAAFNFVALLLAILFSSLESAFIKKPSSPSYAVEGQNITLAWTYTLDGAVGFSQFTIVTGGSELLIGKKFDPGVIRVKPEYQARFRARATKTRAELSILAVQRSDERTYRVNVVPTGAGSLVQSVDIIVNFPPTIVEISGSQTVTEGENVTLKCLADGKLMPNIIWTRLSDNRVVSMTLTDIRRQDAGVYRCIVYNGIGSPAARDVFIVVQYPVEAIGFGENARVPQGGNKRFSCPVDGNPKPNITWYRSSEVSETPIFSGEKLEARESGCYTCVASNSVGNPVSITQCLESLPGH